LEKLYMKKNSAESGTKTKKI